MAIAVADIGKQVREILYGTRDGVFQYDQKFSYATKTAGRMRGEEQSTPQRVNCCLSRCYTCGLVLINDLCKVHPAYIWLAAAAQRPADLQEWHPTCNSSHTLRLLPCDHISFVGFMHALAAACHYNIQISQ